LGEWGHNQTISIKIHSEGMTEMKVLSRFLKVSAASLLLLFSMIGCNDGEVTHESASVEELGQMNRDFAEALIDGDAAAAAMLYDENASLLPPNEPIVTGRANIQAYWQGAIDAGIVDASVQTIDAKSDGDLGYEIGTFELVFEGENGERIIDRGKYTEILERNAEGKWISLYGMWSTNEPAPTE
jgi:ketosteroid isomerase-like protein